VRLRKKDNKIAIDTPAKLNLFLEVVGKRADGYHLLQTVMVPITLFDSLVFRGLPDGSGINLICDDEGVPTDERNTVVKAVRSFGEYYGLKDLSLDITLEKRIPFGAGLGGGSSDAAATIIALYQLFGIPFNAKEACEIAVRVGADCPFFIHCRPALLEGIGDEFVKFLKLPMKIRFLVFVPNIISSTTSVYKNVRLTNEKKCAKLLIDCIDRTDVGGMKEEFFNRLEEAAFRTYGELGRIASCVKEVADFVMSGSGCSFFWLVDEKDKSMVLERLKKIEGKVFEVSPYEWDAVRNRLFSGEEASRRGGGSNESDRGSHQAKPGDG